MGPSYLGTRQLHSGAIIVSETDVVIGVDVGGTHLRCIVARPTGDVIEARSGDSAPPGEIGALLRSLDAGSRNPAAAVHIAAAGVASPQREAAFRKALSESSGLAADRISVGTDVEAAYRAALGRETGILLLAGTGSIAWGRGPDGRTARRGGLGPVLDDRGSGFDLGLQALRSCVGTLDGVLPSTALTRRIVDALGPVDARSLAGWAGALNRRRRQIAALSVDVMDAWRAGDAEARAWVERGAAELARLVRAVARELEMTSPTVALAGGVLEGAGDYADLVKSVLGDGDLKATFVKSILPPVAGAVLIALDRLNARDGETSRATLRRTMPGTFAPLQPTV